jgi:hypothetical protein
MPSGVPQKPLYMTALAAVMARGQWLKPLDLDRFGGIAESPDTNHSFQNCGPPTHRRLGPYLPSWCKIEPISFRPFVVRHSEVQ